MPSLRSSVRLLELRCLVVGHEGARTIKGEEGTGEGKDER